MSNNQLEQTKNDIVAFIRETFAAQGIDRAVIAVSGGIDSAVSLTLTVQALGAAAVTAVLLPYGKQSMSDAEEMCRFVGLEDKNIVTINIKPLVDQVLLLRGVTENGQIRRGNIMARMRMILLFDIAREQTGLVCGTENKSEHYLGYFTRFGDAASDVEPLSGMYKTQVRALAQLLELPQSIINKAPSAGLWDGQTDEKELGFSYEVADQVLTELIDKNMPSAEIRLPGITTEQIELVCKRVKQQAFKRAVPYTME